MKYDLIKLSNEILISQTGLSANDMHVSRSLLTDNPISLNYAKNIVEDLWEINIPESSIKEEDFPSYEGEEENKASEVPERLNNEILKAEILRHLIQAISTNNMMLTYKYFIGEKSESIKRQTFSLLFPYFEFVKHIHSGKLTNSQLKQMAVAHSKVIKNEKDNTPVILINAKCAPMYVHEIAKGVGEVYSTIPHLMTLNAEDAHIVNQCSNTPSEEVYHIASGLEVFKRFKKKENKFSKRLLELSKMPAVDFLTYIAEEHPYLIIEKFEKRQ